MSESGPTFRLGSLAFPGLLGCQWPLGSWVPSVSLSREQRLPGRGVWVQAGQAPAPWGCSWAVLSAPICTWGGVHAVLGGSQTQRFWATEPFWGWDPQSTPWPQPLLSVPTPISSSWPCPPSFRPFPQVPAPSRFPP